MAANPEQQQAIADGVCVGLHPDLPAKPEVLVKSAGKLEAFAAGQAIIRQGEPVTDASKFYLIRRGRVRFIAVVPRKGAVAASALRRGLRRAGVR